MKHLIFTSYLILCMLAGLISAGCSHADAPTNLEPKLILLEATQITRTSAVISMKVENPGSASLSYLRFCYGKDGKINNVTGNVQSTGSVIHYELTDLTPGTTYQYYAEGGTSSATLTTETFSFTTFPNEKPKVSQVRTLSSGPTGVVVEFEIIDDGGETLSSAGCEIKEVGTDEPRRIYLSATELSQGKHNLYITGLKLRTSYNISSFASNSGGETVSEPIDFTTQNGVILLEPGILSSLFGDFPVASESLYISGYMNGSDFRFLRKLVGAPVLSGEEPIQSAVKELELADVNIVEGGGTYDNSRTTEKDIVSKEIFADCKQLKSVILPNSVIAIQRDAFARCPVLESFNVPLNVNELTPSVDCPNLKAIDVSEANPHYSSIDGVVFNKDATEIYWFPVGKTGHFELPMTITAIGERAFMGTHITSLAIPESVTVIQRGAFFGSALEQIDLPNKITNISEGMFQDCSSLHIVKLGTGVELIGNLAFDGTTLTDLYIAATQPPFVYSDSFINNSYALLENCTLHVPAGCRSIYRNHAKWKQFKRIIEN